MSEPSEPSEQSALPPNAQELFRLLRQMNGEELATVLAQLERVERAARASPGGEGTLTTAGEPRVQGTVQLRGEGTLSVSGYKVELPPSPPLEPPAAIVVFPIGIPSGATVGTPTATVSEPTATAQVTKNVTISWVIEAASAVPTSSAKVATFWDNVKPVSAQDMVAYIDALRRLVIALIIIWTTINGPEILESIGDKWSQFVESVQQEVVKEDNDPTSED